MKLPSISYLANNAKESLYRFPLTLLSALLAVVVGIYLTEVDHKKIFNIFPYINLMLCLGLGIVLFFCTGIYAEKKIFSSKQRWIIDGIATLILVGLYFTLPNSDSTQNTTIPYIRYGIYNLTIHLLVSFSPFLATGQINGFWNYNKTLFLRILTAMLFSTVLFGGLALALGSLDWLFDIDLHTELFLEIWIFIAGVFNTWFFLSGIPKDLNKLDEVHVYPKGLKIFAQYVLLPLLILYLIILYVYGGKILFTWSWPKGLVSYLITCVSVLGILTILLLYPYGKEEGNGWIKKISRWYYVALFPLVGLLFIAIFIRLDEYGITINRYVIVLLGVWISLVCCYFISGRKNIKFIPTSLAIMLVIMSFGPWSIFSVSERSQITRLESILEEVKILKNGKIQNELLLNDSSFTVGSSPSNLNEKLLTDSLHNEVWSILNYLDDHHGFVEIRDWYAQDIDSLVKLEEPRGSKIRTYRYTSEAEYYMAAMGLKPEQRYEAEEILYTGYSSDANRGVLDVSGFDQLASFSHYAGGEVADEAVDANDTILHYEVTFNRKAPYKMTVLTGNEKIAVPFELLSGKLRSNHKKEEKTIPASEMSVVLVGINKEIRMDFYEISFIGTGDSLELNSISGKLFIKFKK